MTTDNELDWSAFCYVAGELSASQAAEFESRLASEQPAREALARAVELTQVIAATKIRAAVPVAPPRREHTSRRQRLAWIAIGGLACSLLIAVVSSMFVQHSGQARLAAAWSETLHQLQSAAEPELWPLNAASPDLDDELVATSDGTLDETIDETPSWLDAALQGSAEDSSGD